MLETSQALIIFNFAQTAKVKGIPEFYGWLLLQWEINLSLQLGWLNGLRVVEVELVRHTCRLKSLVRDEFCQSVVSGSDIAVGTDE